MYLPLPKRKGNWVQKWAKVKHFCAEVGEIKFLTAVRKRDCIVAVCNNTIGKKMVPFGKIEWCHFNYIFPCCHCKNRNGVIKKNKVV
jgi:hypothetical protein